MTNKAFIQRQMKVSGLSETEVEQLIEQSDFTDDANTFNKDKLITKNRILIALAEAYERWTNSTDPEEARRAGKLYKDLLRYAEGFNEQDFTSDGRRSDADLLSALEESAERVGTATSVEERKRAIKLHDEIFEELQRRLALSDFTDDGFSSGSYPASTQLVSAMDRLYHILVRLEKSYMNEIEKMSDADSDKIYRHRLIKEFDLDIIP